MTGLTRRQLLLRAVPLGMAGIAFARAARAADACVQPESESLRASLNYVSSSANASATCAHCAYFARDPAGDACGACQILSGPVDAAGYCESFSPPA